MRNPPFCSFALFLTFLLTHFINKPGSYLTISIISFICSLEIINFVLPDPNIYLWIAASVADAVAVNPNGIKTSLANGFNKFYIKGNPAFSNGPKSWPNNPPILFYWVFDNFILADELFVKALWSLETFVLVNNNLCRKIPTIFDESSKVTSVWFFIPDFIFLIFELDNVTFKVLY